MAQDKYEVVVDLSKANHELARMNRGEIPFDADYIKELIEWDGGILAEFSLDINLTCDLCGSSATWVECPECQVTKLQADCFMCEGAGGFYDCLKCNGDAGILP